MIENLIYTGLGILLILIIAIVLTFRYVIFGLKIFFMSIKTKNNVGFVFIRNLSGNYGLPYCVNLLNSSFDIKIGNEKKTYFLQKETFRGFTFLGYPACFFNADNMITSIGHHFHQLDEEGNPIYKEDGEPAMTVDKPSFSLDPSLIKAIITGKALTAALEELFLKYKTQIYILIGIGLGIGLTVYLVYEIKSVDIPQIISTINEVKEYCKPIGQTVVLNG